MRARWRRLRQNEDGAAFIGFALTLPVMLILFYGSYEGTQALRASMKLSNAAQTMAALVSEQGAVSASTVSNFCTGTKMVLAPFSTTNFSAAIASVTLKGTTKTLDWNDVTCGSATAVPSATTLAANVVSSDAPSVIIVKTSYTYTAFVHFVMPATFTLTQIAYAQPRGGTTVVHN